MKTFILDYIKKNTTPTPTSFTKSLPLKFIKFSITDHLQKKRKSFDSSKHNFHLLKKYKKNINNENNSEEIDNNSIKEDKMINTNGLEKNNPKFSQFYHSSKENILYFSKALNPPKYFQSSFENYPFYCSYNSFQNNREYNEDKILISCQKNSKFKLHLFSIFDGHNGDKCCNYLLNYFDKILFSNKNILQKPSRALKETYIDCENKFFELYKPKNLLIPIEKSGSCALSLLVIDKKIYTANAGDSRALYSEKGSKEVYQISYEHKPQNELKRIKKTGCKVYSPLNCNVWRLFPGAIAVNISI